MAGLAPLCPLGHHGAGTRALRTPPGPLPGQVTLGAAPTLRREQDKLRAPQALIKPLLPHEGWCPSLHAHARSQRGRRDPRAGLTERRCLRALAGYQAATKPPEAKL